MFFVFQSFDLQKKKLFTAVVHVIIANKKNDFERIKLINVLSLLYFCLCTCVMTVIDLLMFILRRQTCAN